MRKIACICASLVFSSALFAQTGWRLAWSDEFNGPANTAPDASKWAYDAGAGGWGNAEWETYTKELANAHLDGAGHLVIRAEHPSANLYTSARLKTQDKFTTTYGKIEARLKLPYGQGIWPAFWMLGADIGQRGWPASGEIDIMENIGREPSIVHATVHGPGYSGAQGIGAAYTISAARFADDFHVFSVAWSHNPDQLEFFVDGHSYHKVTPANLPSGAEWVYNKPFFILLNLAVGGYWPGNPDASTVFPQEMLVDYVRVYEQASGSAIHSGGVVNAASYTHALAPGALASVFGVNMASSIADNLFDAAADAFPTAVQGTSVTVNGTPAPLTYISAGQVNFQIPWETAQGSAEIRIVHDGATSAAEAVTVQATAPAVFASSDGAAIMYCTGTEPPGAADADRVCTVFGNGFGAKKLAQRTGVPSPRTAIDTTDDCTMTIAGGEKVAVTYCGVAPTLVIDQLNFVYPSSLVRGPGTVGAHLAVGPETGSFLLPLIDPNLP